MNELFRNLYHASMQRLNVTDNVPVGEANRLRCHGVERCNVVIIAHLLLFLLICTARGGIMAKLAFTFYYMPLL